MLVRRVVGTSMLPALRPGRVVIATNAPRTLRAGMIIMLRHDGKEKIKRIHAIEGDTIYVLGDNPADSTDSRQFGWITRDHVIGRIIWPR